MRRGEFRGEQTVCACVKVTYSELSIWQAPRYMLHTSQQPCEVGTFISSPFIVRKLTGLRKRNVFPESAVSKLVAELGFEATNTHALIHQVPPSITDCREIRPADFSLTSWLVTSWLPRLAFDKYGHLKAPKEMAFWRLVSHPGQTCPQCPHGN